MVLSNSPIYDGIPLARQDCPEIPELPDFAIDIGPGAVNPPPGQPEKRMRVSIDESPPPGSSLSHVCHICKRAYERADHLARHMRSHENARPYQCSRCPKRFNRMYVSLRRSFSPVSCSSCCCGVVQRCQDRCLT